VEITLELFDQERRPRLGNANPERMQLAFWELMVRHIRIAPYITIRCCAAFLAFWIFLLSGCHEAPPPSRIYFVPVGYAPTDQIDDLVDYYRDRFGLHILVLPPMTTDPEVFNSSRNQLIAENVLDSMLRKKPTYARDESAVLIGITTQDMYPREENWQFCFGWRVPGKRAAVVSTARMDIHYPGEPGFEATVTKRLRKMVTKDIGILYYRKAVSDNPKSVLYNGILGIQELNQVGEDF